jgi:hypothetical protein
MWQDLFKHEKNVQIDKTLLYVLAPNQDHHSVQTPFSAALVLSQEFLETNDLHHSFCSYAAMSKSASINFT